MKVVYSFAKSGYEARYWEKEIAAASTSEFEFIPFNHGRYLNPYFYWRAQLLDNLYFANHPGLLRLYGELERILTKRQADALIVDTFQPYHPDYLRKHANLYKVLRTSDGPVAAYDRDFAYLHAYDHVFYHSPAYSPQMGMAEKLRYCGATKVDLWPMALFDQLFDVTKTEENILSQHRDIDVLFIGSLHVGKMPLLSKVKKALGARCRLHGVASIKKNVYFNLRYGFPGWLTRVAFEDYVPLYQRTKIGFNVHNRGSYTVGSYRLFDLPGNGVMQISDGGSHLDTFFRTGDEIIRYDGTDDLIEKIQYYLKHDDERRRIALNGFRRVIKDHRIAKRMHEAGALIQSGIQHM